MEKTLNFGVVCSKNALIKLICESVICVLYLIKKKFSSYHSTIPKTHDEDPDLFACGVFISILYSKHLILKSTIIF